MDAARLRQSSLEIEKVLDVALDDVLKATGQAVVEVANDINSDAQQRINNRSGDLSRAATVEDVVFTDDEISALFGFNSIHGRQTDKGGPILPRHGRMLAIPLDPILTARGVSQYPSPRAEPGLFVLKLWGKVFLAKQMGKGPESIQLHWLLTPRVDQPGTKYFTAAVEGALPDIPRRVGQRAADVLAGGGVA
jgi:hypothetical protein